MMKYDTPSRRHDGCCRDTRAYAMMTLIRFIAFFAATLILTYENTQNIGCRYQRDTADTRKSL